MMLTLLIPGPLAPGKDMDVFLRLSVDELKKPWDIKVVVKDSALGCNSILHVALLCTINDFSEQSSLLGWSGQWYILI